MKTCQCCLLSLDFIKKKNKSFCRQWRKRAPVTDGAARVVGRNCAEAILFYFFTLRNQLRKRENIRLWPTATRRGCVCRVLKVLEVHESSMTCLQGLEESESKSSKDNCCVYFNGVKKAKQKKIPSVLPLLLPHPFSSPLLFPSPCPPALTALSLCLSGSHDAVGIPDVAHGILLHLWPPNVTSTYSSLLPPPPKLLVTSLPSPDSSKHCSWVETNGRPGPSGTIGKYLITVIARRLVAVIITQHRAADHCNPSTHPTAPRSALYCLVTAAALC